MRVAILSCLDFSVPGGAERFFIDMAVALDATIVCLSYNPALGDCYPLAKNVTFHPLNVTLPNEPFKQVFGMHLFRSLNLDYDFFIVTDDMALRFISHGRPHCYVMLTPRRALYDMYYQTIADFSLSKKLIYVPVLSFFRFLDRRFVMKNVTHIAAISHTVRNRIWKAYQRQANVFVSPNPPGKLRKHGIWRLLVIGIQN